MPNRYLQWMLSGTILSLVAFLGYVVMGHIRSQTPSASLETAILEVADAGLEGFVYRQTKNGIIQWEVTAQKAEVFESKHEAILETVELRLFGHDGEEMMLQAQEGMLDTETNDFELRNREELIAIELQNGYTIFVPNIRWIDAKQEIRTPHPVTIQGKGLKITGIGLVGYLEAEEFTVLDNVRVESLS